jgi:hypothetical protein
MIRSRKLLALVLLSGACSIPDEVVDDSAASPGKADSDDRCASDPECARERCTWETTMLDPAGRAGGPGSVAIDAIGGVHASYYDTSNEWFSYLHRRVGGDWVSTRMAIVNASGDSSVVVDDAGGVHVTFFDTGVNEGLKYAYQLAGGSWSSEFVAEGHLVGAQSSVAVDHAGSVHVVYSRHDFVDGVIDSQVEYAHRALGSGWKFATIDSSDTQGKPSVAMDDSGGLHVSYYDAGARDLRYAYRSAEADSWSTAVVDSTGNLGRGPSLAVDFSGGVHVSYSDLTNKSLKYGYRDAHGVWSTTTIDTGVTALSALAVDDFGVVHVAYMGPTPDDGTFESLGLRYAARDPISGSWSIATIDPDVRMGVPDLAVDASGAVHVIYGAHGLQYASVACDR